MGKQTALECLIEENESLKQQLDMASVSSAVMIDQPVRDCSSASKWNYLGVTPAYVQSGCNVN